MKKSIYISGIAAANLMLLGSMFKVMHWPGANVMLILSVFLFCVIFLPLALMGSYNNQEEKKYKALHIVTFFVFFIGMTGALFKIMHWPGASVFLLIGIPLPFVLFLPVYLYETHKDKNASTLNFSGVMFGLIFLAVFSVLLALNVSKHVLQNAATSATLYDKFSKFSSAKINNLKVQPDNVVKLRSDELCTYIATLKCELLTVSENNFCENNKLKADYDPAQIFNTDNTDAAARLLHTNGQNKAAELKTKINSYREAVLASGKTNPELTELINGLFDVSDVKQDEQLLTWEQQKFPSYHLAMVMKTLSQIEGNVRFVESELLERN